MVADSNNAILAARGLTKVFKDFWLRPRVTAVDALDLDIAPRQVFGLLGPNGSGKSTTIKVVLGLLFPTRGKVSVFGRLPTDVSIKQRIGYLPEESYLYRFLDARETLDYYGRLFGLDRASRRTRIDMLLEMVGLDAVQRRPVGEYSKGMQRRIGLAQALINDPDLLILDEPTTGMDPIGTRQIKDLILHLRDRGKTVLLSSHLLADVEDVCDRVTILYGGRKRAEGTVDQLLTVDGTLQIQTDDLQPSTIDKIEKLIEAEEGKALRRVEHPRQKLETLFLDIVHQAQREGAATSGAAGGRGVAQFLTRDAHMPESVDGERLIDQLIAGEAKPVASGPPKDAGAADAAQAEAVAPAGGAASSPEPGVVEELMGGEGREAPSDDEGSAASPGTTESAESTESPDRARDAEKASSVDREVLDELLGEEGRRER